jgi:hypothetical protein
MYADILQDAGASRGLWRPAQLVAESLQWESRLLLVEVPGPCASHCPYLPGDCLVVRTRGFLSFITSIWEARRPFLTWVPLRQNCYLGFGLSGHALDLQLGATVVLSSDGGLSLSSDEAAVKRSLRGKSPQKVVSAFFAAHARRAFGRWDLF